MKHMCFVWQLLSFITSLFIAIYDMESAREAAVKGTLKIVFLYHRDTNSCAEAIRMLRRCFNEHRFQRNYMKMSIMSL